VGVVKKTYDLYGLTSSQMEYARVSVEHALGIKLQAHESSYRGGMYFRLNDVGQEHFILQRNYDGFDREWNEPEYQYVPFLLYVNETLRPEELQATLEHNRNIKLLRREKK